MIRDIQKQMFTSILQNGYFKKTLILIRMWWSHFLKLKPVKVSRNWWCPFSMLNFKSRKKVIQPFFSIKIFKIHKKVMRSFLALITVKVVRKLLSPFLSIKNFKNRQAVMVFFLRFRSFKRREKVTESFSNNHASLSFHMMHKIPGTIFSLLVSPEFLWFFSLTKHSFTIHFISMKKDLEHISVNIVRATFLLQ